MASTGGHRIWEWAGGNTPVPTLGQGKQKTPMSFGAGAEGQAGAAPMPPVSCSLGCPQTDNVCELPHATRCSRLFLKPPRTGIASALC